MSLVGFGARNHPQQTRARGANPKVDDRQTPPELFDPLHERFRFTLDVAALPHNAKLPRYFVPPDLHPTAGRCMWATGGECGPRGCSGCEHGGAGPLGRDGLVRSWYGERVWCNPPYSSIEPWVEKAWRESWRADLIVMLVPANRTEQGWWQRHVEPYRDQYDGGCECCGHEDWPNPLGVWPPVSENPPKPLRVEFLKGRQRFIAHDATSVGPNERPPFGVALLIWGGWEPVDEVAA